MRNAVVTGVSTGIGAGIAAELIKAGWHVFGSVRKEADAAAARRRFGQAFTPLLFDTTDEVAIGAAVDIVKVALAGERLDGLVNNAGIALSAPLLVQASDDFRRQIEVNLIGPFLVTKAFAPLLGAIEGATGAKGRIVNISSVGGRLAAPFLGAYVASKHALEGLSDSLRRELQIFGVDVIVVGPGSVATPIWDKAEADEMAGADRLSGTLWAKPFKAFTDYLVKDGRKGLSPEAVGDVVVEALTAAKPKARYAPVPGKFMNWVVPTNMPKRMLDGVIGKQLGLLPKR